MFESVQKRGGGRKAMKYIEILEIQILLKVINDIRQSHSGYSSKKYKK
jgi:hypothetical protein